MKPLKVWALALGAVALVLTAVGLGWRLRSNVTTTPDQLIMQRVRNPDLPPNSGDFATRSVLPGRDPGAIDPDHWPRADTLDIAPDESLNSLWIDAEKKRFLALLKTRPCDTLVVPVQSQRFGFDRVTRSLMTAQLARLIGADQKRCVVDPYLAARALGEGMRRFDAQAVHDFARALKAKTIIWTYAGHDGHMKMDLFIRAESARDDSFFTYGESHKKSWAAVPFSDEQPPFVAWLDILPDVMKTLELNVGKAPISLSNSSEFDLPDAPEQLVAKPPGDALENARRFETLALLAPALDSRATERFFEKAWLAAGDVPDSADARRVRARALYHIGYRPTALSLLKDDNSADAQVLRALLNGNLPEAQKAQGELTTEPERFLAALEINDLTLEYGRHVDAKALAALSDTLTSRSNGWAALLPPRASEFDGWKIGDNRPLKILLDALYPIDGFSYEDVVRGTIAATQTPTEAELALLPIRHINRLIEEQPALFCCDRFALRPQPYDLLDLIASRATANLEKRVTLVARLQRRTDDAMQYLDQLGAEFSGHPYFTALRAEALTALVKSRTDGASAERQRQIYSAARQAAFWEQGNTMTAYAALLATGLPSATSIPFLDAYDNDFPPKAYWRHWREMHPAAMRAYESQAARYSTNNAQPALSLLDASDEAARKGLVAEFGGRFHGAPQESELRAKLAGKKEEDSGTLRARIAADPANWDLYWQLSKKLIETGDYDAALVLVKRYPGFEHKSGENTVALSNYAASVASELYWRGAIDQAKVLYRVAADYQTGSEAGMMGDQRIRLLDGDYIGSAQVLASRVARYSNPYALSDYISMLFVFGDAKDGWAAFGRVAGQYDTAELWKAAIVGHRIGGTPTQKVVEWLMTDGIRTIRFDGSLPALRFGMTWFLIDRAPYADLEATLVRLEGEPQTVVEGDIKLGVHRRVRPDGAYSPVTPSKFRESEHSLGSAHAPVPSEFVLFAKAYVALRQGDHAAAVTAFDRLSTYYSIEGAVGADAVMALPYFAYSSAKSGDTLGLKAFLDSLPQEQRHFEFHLAQAYFAGLSGQHEDAIRELGLALGKMNARFGATYWLTYQYAEACVWLFEDTHDARYRDLALDWARKHQRLDPTMAWAYALEAHYGDSKGSGHLRAVALAQYLDRDSFWLSSVPQADRERARAWFKHNNPFTAKVATDHAI